MMLLARLRNMFWQTVRYFRPPPKAQTSALFPTQPSPRAAPPPTEAPPPPPAEAEAEPAPEPEPEPELAPAPAINRTTRRKLERARRRHDKFVTPKGPAPISIPRGPRKERGATPPPAEPRKPGDDQILVADTPPGGDEKVLYEESEFWGEFNFRDTILDQLDRYFFYLQRMQKHDPHGYAFYRQVGATLLPYVASGAESRDAKSDDPEKWKLSVEQIEKYKSEITLPPWFNQQRPAFGCFAWGANPSCEQYEKAMRAKGKWVCVPRFMYFTKYASPPSTLQPMSGGDVYSVTIWWDEDTKKRKHGVPQVFGVFVSADGNTIQVLRQLMSWEERIPSKKRRQKYFTVPRRDWRIPHEYEMWARDHGLDAATHLAHIFTDAIMRHEHSNYAMIRVAVKKGDMTAVFGVSPRRMAYFFQDRDITLTATGAKRRIFHIVKPYQTKRGSNVPMHFRGLREFEWAGYAVSITVPGLDHLMLPSFDLGTVDEEWVDDKTRSLDEEELGGLFAEMIANKETTLRDAIKRRRAAKGATP